MCTTSNPLPPLPLAAGRGRWSHCPCLERDIVAPPYLRIDRTRYDGRDPFVLPMPVAVSPTSPRRYAQDRTSNSALTLYFGTMCLSIVAGAFTLDGNAPMSPTLLAASVCGAVGSVFVAAALLCKDEHGGGIFIFLTMVCSAMGTTCVVAGLGDWLATTVTCVCVVGTVGIVLYKRGFHRWQ